MPNTSRKKFKIKHLLPAEYVIWNVGGLGIIGPKEKDGTRYCSVFGLTDGSSHFTTSSLKEAVRHCGQIAGERRRAGKRRQDVKHCLRALIDSL